MQKIGITTTIPSEVLLAAGYTPIDLNNLYINAPNRDALVKRAEKDGFPINTCTWIKGIYGAIVEQGIQRVICVATGDCSNTEMLMEVLRLKDIDGVPFYYPPQPSEDKMLLALESLAYHLGTTLKEAENIREKLLPVRKNLKELDKLTYQSGQVSGYENHIWQVSSSDFNGHYKKFATELVQFLKQAKARAASKTKLRLGFIGVPPVYAASLYNHIEEYGAQVVFNETQRQFAMPYEASNLAKQYSLYTYPYNTCLKIDDINRQIEERQLNGIIHYVQTFCHRGISDIIYRQKLNCPILTLEGNDSYVLSLHQATRIEAFLDILLLQN